MVAFWSPGAVFCWSSRVLEIYCNIAALAGWAGGFPKSCNPPDWVVKCVKLPYDQQYNRLLDWDYRTEGLQELKDWRIQN